MKKILAIALVMILALTLLTACGGDNNNGGGGNNNSSGDSTPTGNNGDSGNNNNSGNNSIPEGNNNSGGSAENYPDYWNDDVPKLNGIVTFSMELGENNLSLFIDVKNKSVIDDYIKSLESDGYEKHIDKSDETHRDVALKNGTWNIHINYNHADDDNNIAVKLNHSPDIS